MPKTKTNDLLKNEPYPSIIRMLQAFLEEGLESKHFRYELIGEDSLKPDNAKKVNSYLKKGRFRYIHKIDKEFLKGKKNPDASLERALRTLMKPQHRVIYRKKPRYFLTNTSFYIKLVAEEDKKNIDYNVTINKLNTIEDIGINLYGYPSGEMPAFICHDHKRYLKRLFTEGVKRIASGTNLLQNNILHISLQVKVNIWKDVLDILENKKICLLDRQILLSFFVISLDSSLMAYCYFNKWFDTDNSTDFWFLKKEWITKCSTSEDGRIGHPAREITIKKPDRVLKEIIKIIDPSKKEGNIHLELKNHVINEDVSDLIISLLMLPSLPAALGTLCVVSSPPTHRFFDILEVAGELAMINISTESALAKMDNVNNKEGIKSRLKSAKTLEDWVKVVLEEFGSDELGENLMASYKKKKLDYRVKFAERERDELRYIMEEEGKDSVALSSLSKTTDILEIIKLLAPKE